MDSILMWIKRSDCKFAEFLRKISREVEENGKDTDRIKDN